ncbi:hypothetical protein OV079_52820 [Nannocystis pusilla]|uniref:Uncharacterized protein n=1 Tax=Nannocystis pusilla TaxID=889268 RepID=A0A9X3J491_9BACT|nr:hypothetical protein [Nannocystis pusilla]MCY1014065.1 hypothetical protein [Nannocystis pusilla]
MVEPLSLSLSPSVGSTSVVGAPVVGRVVVGSPVGAVVVGPPVLASSVAEALSSSPQASSGARTGNHHHAKERSKVHGFAIASLADRPT